MFAKKMRYPADLLLQDDNFGFFWADLDLAILRDALNNEFRVGISGNDLAVTPQTIRYVAELVQRLCPKQGNTPGRGA